MAERFLRDIIHPFHVVASPKHERKLANSYRRSADRARLRHQFRSEFDTQLPPQAALMNNSQVTESKLSLTLRSDPPLLIRKLWDWPSAPERKPFLELDLSFAFEQSQQEQYRMTMQFGQGRLRHGRDELRPARCLDGPCHSLPRSNEVLWK